MSKKKLTIVLSPKAAEEQVAVVPASYVDEALRTMYREGISAPGVWFPPHRIKEVLIEDVE